MTKEESQIIKGVAIMLMLFLHLFSKENITELCQPLIYVNGKPLVYLLSRAASPVAFFIILSGYGHGYLYNARRISLSSQVKRLLKLYITYWVVLAIFVSIGSFIRPNVYPGGPWKIIENITGWNCTYNYETWFLFPYTLISLTAYPIFRVLDKVGSKITLIVSFFLSFTSSYITSRYIAVYHLYDTVLAHILTYLGFFFCFVLGAVFYRYSQRHEIKFSILKGKPLLTLLVMTILVFIRCLFTTGAFHSLYVFVFIILFLHIPLNSVVRAILTSIGKVSMPIWMVHSFFCYYLFKDFIYGFRYPLIIFIVLLLVSYVVSIPIMKLSSLLYRVLPSPSSKSD